MEQPPKFMPDKELSKVGGSLWLYIIMQLTLSFLFSFVAMPLICLLYTSPSPRD